MEKLAFLLESLDGSRDGRIARQLSFLLSPSHEILWITLKAHANTEHPGKVLVLRQPGFGGVLGTLELGYQLKQLAKTEGFRTVISFTDATHALALSLKARRRILSVRGAKTQGLLNRRRLLTLLRKADAIVTPTQDQWQKLIDFDPVSTSKILAIPMAIDPEKYQLAEVPPPHPFTFVTNGRLVRSKGHVHLIRAFKTVVQKFPEAQLVILGEGKLKGELEELVLELGLPESVHFPGTVLHPQKVFQQSDVYVLSSLSEGYAQVLVEAMASGLPIISTDCEAGPVGLLAPKRLGKPQLKTVHKGPYGILVPAFSAEESHEETRRKESLLAKAMVQMAEDHRLRDRYIVMGQKRIERYKPEAVTEAWIEVIEGKF